jgi:uncharacterized membrane protein HdeD (DUF308 family)
VAKRPWWQGARHTVVFGIVYLALGVLAAVTYVQDRDRWLQLVLTVAWLTFAGLNMAAWVQQRRHPIRSRWPERVRRDGTRWQ